MTRALRSLALALSLFLLGPFARAQETPVIAPPAEEAIEDNSFFLEEAYNQEDRVVQHISTFTYFQKPLRQAGYTFTQEWPLGGQTHQLSYDLSYGSLGDFSGMGDLAINYRYQWRTKEDGAAVTPRLSILLPTGDEKKGLGIGATGAEIGAAASSRLSGGFVAHANLGAAFFPGVKVPTVTGASVRRLVSAYYAGASIIWLADARVNILLEGISVFSSEPDQYADMRLTAVHLLSPGARCAIDVGSLQIVPGVAVPVRFHDGVSETGVFGYLSFEHPF